jgi:hypothetical protein
MSQPAICGTRIPLFRCPSDPRDGLRPDAGVQFAPTNYGFSIGTWLAIDQLTGTAGDGAFAVNERRTFASVTDGLSSTLAMAEVKTFIPALLDGSSRTISSSVDRGVWRAPGTRDNADLPGDF